jgi:hypothetical protein
VRGGSGQGVVKAVNSSARDKESFPRADFNRLAIERQRQDTLKAKDGLVEGIVTVGSGNLGAGRDCQLKDGPRGSGSRAIDEKPNSELSDANL